MLDKNPEISIIVPVYNVEKYLAFCLESVKKQTFSDWECICVDDASTDKSLEIIRAFVILDKRFICISQTLNKGPSASRNAGLCVAKGKYIIFLDGDDAIKENMLQYYHSFFEKYDIDYVSSDYMKFSDEKDIIAASKCFSDEGFAYLKEPFKEVLNKKTSLSMLVCAKMYRKDFLTNVFFDEEMRMYEDSFFSLDLLSRSKGIVISKEKNYFYRYNPLSLSGRKNYDEQIEYVYKNLRKVYDFCQQKEITGQQREEAYRLAGGELFLIFCKNIVIQCITAGNWKRYDGPLTLYRKVPPEILQAAYHSVNLKIKLLVYLFYTFKVGVLFSFIGKWFNKSQTRD